MDSETAKSLIPLVNKTNMDLLEIYTNHRIEYLRKQLETADISMITTLQGQIKEVRRLLTLRDEVQKERS